jgi:hypothetical protein
MSGPAVSGCGEIINSCPILSRPTLPASTMIAMYVSLAVEPGLVRAVAYNVMVIPGLSTIVFSGRSVRDGATPAFPPERRADSLYPKRSRYSVCGRLPALAFGADGRQTHR